MLTGYGDNVTSEQQAVQRATTVEASATIARRVSAARGDAAKVVSKYLARGPLPAHAGTPEAWHEDNCAPTGRVEGRGVREALADVLEPLGQDGTISGLLPNALAPLLLASLDLEHGCPVERLPRPSVTFERCLAHVESLSVGMSGAVQARVAARLTLVLLNHGDVRRPIAVRADALPPLPPLPPLPAMPAMPADDVQVVSHAAQGGRQPRGYARIVGDLEWSAGTPQTPVGTILEVLTPNEHERGELQQMEQRSAPSIVVWWAARVRLVPKSAVVPASRAEWNEWTKENL